MFRYRASCERWEALLIASILLVGLGVLFGSFIASQIIGRLRRRV
jgi:hypothetical protein